MKLSKKQITIGIVACSRDIKLLDRLLKSIRDFTTVEQIREIIIVWNDQKNSDFDWLKHQNYGVTLTVIHGSEIHPLGPHPAYNWYSQQYYKLRLCEYSKTYWTLIHDCKDYYLQHTDFFADCITEDNRARMVTDHNKRLPETVERQHNYIRCNYGDIVNPNGNFAFDLALMICLDSWRYHPVPSEPFETLWSQTPFWFHTETVREMNTVLSQRFGGFFPWLFNMVANEGDPIFTEFLLYNGYVISKNRLEQLYQSIPYGSGYILNYRQSREL